MRRDFLCVGQHGKKTHPTATSADYPRLQFIFIIKTLLKSKQGGETMYTTIKRVLSALLCVVLLCGLIPSSAFAASETEL